MRERLERAPTLHAALVTAYQFQARIRRTGTGPRVLANGMPKSGTHLLSTLLANLPRLRFSGRHYSFDDFRSSTAVRSRSDATLDWKRLQRAIQAVNRGQYMTAHFPSTGRLVEILNALDFKTVVIFRDPRDVVVSNAFYIAKESRHWLHDYFVSEVPDLPARILTCIRGVRAPEGQRGLESIGGRLNRQAGWREEQSCYVTHFEDLVGPSGGGTERAQLREIKAIADHIHHPLTESELLTLAGRTWDDRSPTFRKGSAGSWIDHFSEAHKDAFKEVAGQQLIDLGYETNLDW